MGPRWPEEMLLVSPHEDGHWSLVTAAVDQRLLVTSGTIQGSPGPGDSDQDTGMIIMIPGTGDPDGQRRIS